MSWKNILKIDSKRRNSTLRWLDELVMFDLPLQIAKKINNIVAKDKGGNYILARKVQQLPDGVKGEIAHKFTKLYETYDKPKPKGASHTRKEQFEEATTAQIEQLARYLMHLIEVA